MRDLFSKYRLVLIPIIVLLLITQSSTIVCAQQSQSQLKAERLRINEEIEATEKSLNSATSSKASTLSKINALELQVDARSRLIENLKKEEKIKPINNEEEIIGKQKDEKHGPKFIEEYVKILRIQYRNKLLQRKHSLTLHDHKRFLTKNHYLNIYRELLIQNTDTQAALIDATFTTYENISQASEKDIEEQIQEKNRLQQEMQALILKAKNMTLQEKAIQQKLDDQFNKRESYNQAIEKLLIKSLGQQNSNASNATPYSLHNSLPEIAEIERKRGFLPYPVANYTITKIFGPQPHPEIANITIDNKGIDIETRDLEVKSIYGGVIAGISEVGQNTSAVIINHGGDYYSVYSGLSTINVSEGEVLSSRQIVGLLPSRADGTGKLHFEFYKGQQKMNPKHWLKNN